MAEQSVGRGAADRVVPEADVDWRRPGQRRRYLHEIVLASSTLVSYFC
jgi:PHP family Zn ribbon phosphoesterase